MSECHGIDISRLRVGENRIACPKCCGESKKRNLSVNVQADGHAIWHCHRCLWDGATGGPSYAPKRPVQATKATMKPRALSAYGLSIWNAAMALAGPARAYLEARACLLPPADGHLRFLPVLGHPCGYKGPALVALVTDALSAEPISLHRTWIRPDGSKAPVDLPRLLLKDHSKAGGVIRLWQKDCATSCLGIAEGIETALSLAHGMTPAWACIDAGNLAAFPLIDGVDQLVIAADNDPTGRNAAATCAERWTLSGRKVRIVTAEYAGSDLNDEVRGWPT